MAKSMGIEPLCNSEKGEACLEESTIKEKALPGWLMAGSIGHFPGAAKCETDSRGT
jgi:hypothetical protein